MKWEEIEAFCEDCFLRPCTRICDDLIEYKKSHEAKKK